MSENISVDEARLLTAAEQEAVSLTLPPSVTKLSRHDLQALAHRLREARDRARAIASQQRREMRGKAEPRGVSPARDDTGTVAKEQVLADALKRVTEQLGHTAGPSDASSDIEEPTAASAPAPRPSGGPPSATRSKKASVPRPTSKRPVAKPSKLPTVRSDPREVGRVTKSIMSAQARRDLKPR